ncbi:MAG: hypothetical protein KGM96_06850 [Acidobacteriota bacterium]|nr:hypothetical protein [Acidobacteriota bacterium]
MASRFVFFFLVLGIAAQFAAAQSNPLAAVADTAARAASIPADDVRGMLNEVRTLIRSQAEQLESQRKQIERQQIEIEELRRDVASARRDGGSITEQELEAASTVALLNSGASSLKATSSVETATLPAIRSAVVAMKRAQQSAGNDSGDAPLSIRFGRGSLTPGGWVDFTAYYRSTDVGSGLGTNFASIPFDDTVQGGLSEARFTAQSSRISVRADENFGATRVFGYAEADFNGYFPPNGYVSTNSDTMRLRVYFTDLSRGRWELLGGQSWSLLTPNRAGVSPFLSEIYNTMHLDTNYQVGLTFARQAQLRAVYHISNYIALGLSAENPQQFSGNAVTFPALFDAAQTDLGSSTGAGGGTATPTLHPDFIAKLSADAGWGDRNWHFEAAGLLTPIAILTPASVTKTGSAKDFHEGSGISVAANLEVVKGLHVILAGFWSDGGGRYIGGLGPAFVVAQPGSSTSPFVARLVHSGSGIAAAEWQASKSTVLSLTYSGAYFGRAISTDPSTGSFVGYGFAGSANSNNRSLQEGTFASLTTLWRHPSYGSVQMITQSSYVTRAPWYVAPKSAGTAHVFEGYANLRYVLP